MKIAIFMIMNWCSFVAFALCIALTPVSVSTIFFNLKYETQAVDIGYNTFLKIYGVKA